MSEYTPKHAAHYNWVWEKDLWKFELALHGPLIPRGRHAA